MAANAQDSAGSVVWSAQWISRPVAPATRVHVAMPTERVDWIGPGQILSQAFRFPGRIWAVSADLRAEDGQQEIRLSLIDGGGSIVASKCIGSGGVPWDRFMAYLRVDPPAPPGTYRLEVSVDDGRVGWLTGTASSPATIDDGVSPLSLDVPTPSGQQREIRAIAVETRPGPNPEFRRCFHLDSTPTRAQLHATALGNGVFRINGVPVSDAVLDPPQTNYERTILYRSVDVTHLVRQGSNELTVAVGRGFFASRGATVWGWHLAPWHREPTVLAQLELAFADGHETMIGTDATWEARSTGVVETTYGGEDHTDEVGEWGPAVVAPAPHGALRLAELPPITRGEPIPGTIIRMGSHGVIADFGRQVAGRVRCRVEGTPGTVVHLKYGESLTGGEVTCINQLSAVEAQLDSLRLGSDGVIDFEAAHTLKGFRYVDVSGPDISVPEVTAIPLGTVVPLVGALQCSNETLDWIDASTVRTFTNNLHGIPTDTPVYEKNGWTADAHLVTDAMLHHFDLRSVLVKWLDDHVDAQDGSGMVPQIVPTPGWGYGPDPAWSGSLVLIPWALYREHGDSELLRRFWPAIRRYVGRLVELSPERLWTLHSWGDWLAPGHTFAPEGSSPAATMMLLHVLDTAGRIAKELGHLTDSERLQRLAREVATAYHREWFDEGSSSYRCPGVGYRQGMNVLPLAFDAVPAEHVAGVIQSLVEDITQRTDGHLDCGAIAVKWLLPVLSRHGHHDVAITVATNPTRPGWEVWRREGLNTLMESWDADARSHDHYFLGSVSSWIQQDVCGLRSLAPGWRAFEVVLRADERVPAASIHHETPQGRVAAAWRRLPDGWTVEVHVPADTTAHLRVGGHNTPLSPGRHRLHVNDHTTGGNR